MSDGHEDKKMFAREAAQRLSRRDCQDDPVVEELIVIYVAVSKLVATTRRIPNKDLHSFVYCEMHEFLKRKYFEVGRSLDELVGMNTSDKAKLTWGLYRMTMAALNRDRTSGEPSEHLKKNSKRPRRLIFAEVVEPAPDESNLAPDFDEEDERKRLWAALKELPDEDRLILFAHHFLKKTHEQIAAEMGYARETVTRKLSKIKSRLRCRLSATG